MIRVLLEHWKGEAVSVLATAITVVGLKYSPFTVWLVSTMVVSILAALLLLWHFRQNGFRQNFQAPFWAVFQTRMAESLHHPHPESQPLDRLLEKLEALTLTLAEREELKKLLLIKQNSKEESEIERNRAKLLLVAMEQVLRERAGGKQ